MEIIMQCDRCGETYRRKDTNATKNFCGTCISINGPDPDDNLLRKKTPQPVKTTESEDDLTKTSV